MGNELPNLVATQKISLSLKHSLTYRAYVPLGRPKEACMLCSLNRRHTESINDLQPHTKLAGEQESPQLGKADAFHALWVPHLLPKSQSKVGQLKICQDSLILHVQLTHSDPA